MFAIGVNDANVPVRAHSDTSPTLVSKVPIGTGGWTSVGDRRTSTSENVLAMKWRAKAPMPDVATRKSTPLVALALS